jgi:protocatechuate 3,4-dioxygenase beta subunit
MLLFSAAFFTNCTGQSEKLTESIDKSLSSNKIIGGGCDGCELMYVGILNNIKSEHVSPGWNEKGQKLQITGKVYHNDGRTPASNVIVYYWHTDSKGLYTFDENTPSKAKRHGRMRGWVKSDANGKYSIKTIRPAPYPNENIPAHIHLSIKEPNLNNEYYADLYFDDKLYLDHRKKYGRFDRAGTEVLRILFENDIQIAEHNIILGLNIPHYPKEKEKVNSGLSIGEDQPSFIPFHAFGPDMGTRACPVCNYGRYHGVIYFVGDNPKWEEIKKWLKFLDNESIKREKYLKAYFVYGNSKNYKKELRQKDLKEIGKALDLKMIALTYVPSFADVESEANLNKINPDVDNTFIIYKNRTIVDKYVNLKPTLENFDLIVGVLEKSKGEYFNLPEQK